MPLLGKEFDVRSVLHGQMTLAAVNHIHVFHEVMNSCKKSEDLLNMLNACFENVNISKYITIKKINP